MTTTTTTAPRFTVHGTRGRWTVIGTGAEAHTFTSKRAADAFAATLNRVERETERRAAERRALEATAPRLTGDYRLDSAPQELEGEAPVAVEAPRPNRARELARRNGLSSPAPAPSTRALEELEAPVEAPTYAVRATNGAGHPFYVAVARVDRGTYQAPQEQATWWKRRSTAEAHAARINAMGGKWSATVVASDEPVEATLEPKVHVLEVAMTRADEHVVTCSCGWTAPAGPYAADAHRLADVHRLASA